MKNQAGRIHMGRLICPATMAVCIAVLPFTGCFDTNIATKTQALTMAVSRNIPEIPGDLAEIPESAIVDAKNKLHIAYGHTSHGSQLITGMDAIAQYKGSLYAFNAGGAGGALDLRDTPFSGASDLGNPDRTAWETATRTYLHAHPDVNVIIWSWCGQVSASSEADITTYLTIMSGLEADYPGVTFVYMTGHTDGGGLGGTLHVRNQMIRDYCRANGKFLFDFETVESYDPGDYYFGNYWVTDGCDYDFHGNGTTDGNWANNWVYEHPGSELTRMAALICGDCCAHSRPLNCVMKGAAAWSLWARIAQRY
jgi:hypothetical protein